MHQVPSFFGLNDVRKRRHGSPVQTGHENLVEILVGGSAFEACTNGEIVWTYRLVVAISERRGRGTIAPSFRAMAFPTFELLEKFLTMLDAVNGELRLRRHGNRITGLVV